MKRGNVSAFRRLSPDLPWGPHDHRLWLLCFVVDRLCSPVSTQRWTTTVESLCATVNHICFGRVLWNQRTIPVGPRATCNGCYVSATYRCSCIKSTPDAWWLDAWWLAIRCHLGRHRRCLFPEYLHWNSRFYIRNLRPPDIIQKLCDSIVIEKRVIQP